MMVCQERAAPQLIWLQARGSAFPAILPGGETMTHPDASSGRLGALQSTLFRESGQACCQRPGCDVWRDVLYFGRGPAAFVGIWSGMPAF
jgi:hypothetical protein